MNHRINNNIFGLGQVLFRYLENEGRALALLAQVLRSLELLTLIGIIRMSNIHQRRNTRFFRTVAREATRRAADMQNHQGNGNQERNIFGWVQRGPQEEVVQLRNIDENEENEDFIDVEN